MTPSDKGPERQRAESARERDVGGLRIALVLGTSAGGVGRHVRSLAAGLTDLGAQVAVLGPPATEDLFGFAAAGARFEPMDISDRPNPVGDLRTVAKLRGSLRAADVVHAHGLRAGALAVAALAEVKRGPLRLGGGEPPLAVTLHNAAPSGGGPAALVYRALERVVARGATVVLGVSPDLEQRMRELGAREVGAALVPAPPAAPAGPQARDAVRAEQSIGERPLIVAGTSRLADQKGLPTLLEASSGWPQALVVIAGDGPLRAALQARIDAEHLPVRLLGRRNDIPALFAAADVIVVPSLWEGQALLIHEALRSGRPQVATRVGGNPRQVGAAALLIPAGDAGALREAVTQILDDPALAVRMGAAAAQRATELPVEADAVRQVARIYRDLASR